MPSFGKASLSQLASCHPKLQKVLLATIADGPDFAIVEGWRGKVAQNAAFDRGASQKRWPDGNHNNMKNGQPYSRAADLAPYPVDWKEGEKPHLRFAFLMGNVYAHAKVLGIKIRFGMDWNQNFIVDESFIDLPHVELAQDEL